MTSELLRSQISAAVQLSWPDFSAEHPALARVIDAAMLEDYVVESLADDTAFASAYRHAVDEGQTASMLADLLLSFVAPLLRRLL